MERSIEAFTDIYAHPRLGSQLTSHLMDEGLAVEHVEPYSNLATDLDGYAGLILELIKDNWRKTSPLARLRSMPGSETSVN